MQSKFYTDNGLCHAKADSFDGDFAIIDGVEYVIDENHMGTAYITTKDGQTHILA